MPQALAVDVGGTKLAAALVDDAGRLTAAEEVPTPTTGTADGLFATLASLVDGVRRRGDPVVVGVGCGGPMTAGGRTVSPVNIAPWRDFPLRDALAGHTGLPTHVDNDAKALALGEGWRGGARGAAHFLAMVVSTGVGGGLVLDGRLLDGRDGNAGHIGHVVVAPDGRRCGCGAQGCLEAEASGTAIRAATGAAPAEAPVEVRIRTGTLVGRAVASVAALLDLPLTVVAGSVALGYADDFFPAAQEEYDRRAAIAHARGGTIRPAGLGADGPLVGAAAVAWRGRGHDVGVR